MLVPETSKMTGSLQVHSRHRSGTRCACRGSRWTLVTPFLGLGSCTLLLMQAARAVKPAGRLTRCTTLPRVSAFPPPLPFSASKKLTASHSQIERARWQGDLDRPPAAGGRKLVSTHRSWPVNCFAGMHTLTGVPRKAEEQQRKQALLTAGTVSTISHRGFDPSVATPITLQ